MGVYAIEKLMSETRRLAVQYHQTTGQVLPVTTELSKFDAIQYLSLKEPPQPISGVDALGQGPWEGKRIQIKGRVVFEHNKAGKLRIGQINVAGAWDILALVLLDHAYEPYEIHTATRKNILEGQQSQDPSKRLNRGAMSVAKFKKLGTLAWSRPE